MSLHAFYVIDHAKKEVEKMCPGVVSCADILAIAARDAVSLSGGPSWEVRKGWKDGRISRASESLQLPFPTFNISQLLQSFSQRGLSMLDLVALSGGHTLGFSHCSSFRNRIYNFNKKTNVDPSLDSSFAAQLRQACPVRYPGPRMLAASWIGRQCLLTMPTSGCCSKGRALSRQTMPCTRAPEPGPWSPGAT